MNYKKAKEIYFDDNIGIDKLSKQERKIALLNTSKWWFGYEKRLKKEVDKILESRLSDNGHNENNSQNKIDNFGDNKNNFQEINNNQQQNHGTFNLPPEDSDEYIPQDMEMGESMGEGPHIFEVSPYLPGYYTGGRKSYFDKNRLIWSKRKQLQNFNKNVDKTKKRFIFAGKIGNGIFSIPLPNNALPDIKTLVSNNKGIEFQIDQNNCIYLKSESVGEFAFDFYIDQYPNNKASIKEDSEKIIKGKLTQKTKDLLGELTLDNKTDLEKAKSLENYIKRGKKYNEKAQGEIFGKSSKNNYFENLDKAGSLECYSSNTLFVGLLRELQIKSRLVVGHHIQQKGKNNKANIGQNTGHAWTEVWDEDKKLWIRFDATPLVREKDDDSGESNQDSGDKQDQNGDNNENSEGNNDSDKQEGQKNKSEDGKQQDGGDKNGEFDGEGGKEENGTNNEEETRSAKEILEEMIEKVEQDDFNKQEKELNKELEEVNNTEDKNKLKEIKEKSDLTKKAKEILEEEIEKKILEKEQEEIQNLKQEEEIDKKIENSILDDENFKRKLREYAKKLKKKIEEERNRKENQMKNYGFSKEELALFDEYMELEKEVKPEIKKNIRKLEKILPKEYKIVEDESMYFSGKQIDKSKLVNYKITGNTRIFKRNIEEVQDIKVNMFETILIDRSGSMGNFEDSESPLRNAIKAAIIRARTLEHFKVDFSIVFFDDDIEEIMTFGEKFGAKRTMIPAKLMRAAKKSGGTNISSPIIFTKEKLTRYSKKQGKKSLGNITFIGDGEPMGGFSGEELKNLIDDTKKNFPITAFYITDGSQNGTELERYFGNKESGGTVVIDNVGYLSKGIVDTFNKNIKKTLRKIQKIK